LFLEEFSSTFFRSICVWYFHVTAVHSIKIYCHRLLLVSLVRVIQKNSENVGEFGSGFLNYHVQHLYVFRKPQQLEELPEYIRTPSVSAACGVNLTVGEYYLLGGRVGDNGTLHISLCGLRRQWNTLQRNETEALSTYTCDDERY
ncbi:tissue inhibitor of metalloproteinase, partial [Ancylostoma caninum]